MSDFIEALTFHTTGQRVPLQTKHLKVSVKRVFPPDFAYDVLETYEAEVKWRSRANTTPEGKYKVIKQISEQLWWDIYKDLMGLLHELASSVYGGDTEKSLELISKIKKETGL